MKQATWLVGLVIPAGLAIRWEVAVRWGLRRERLMPPPSRLAGTAWSLVRSGELQTHVVATMTRALLGFAIGATARTLLGMLNGASTWALRALDPSIQALRAIPPIASLRTGLGLGFMFVVAAELMGASEGLGYLLLDGQQMGRADSILVAMIVFALLGNASDSVLVALSRRVLRWQDTNRLRL
jgi:ABC-type nitrate/sulfonate/bicarbonate transport system permease component